MQHLLTLIDRIIACVDDLYFHAKPACCLFRYSRLLLLIIIIIGRERDQELGLFHLCWLTNHILTCGKTGAYPEDIRFTINFPDAHGCGETLPTPTHCPWLSAHPIGRVALNCPGADRSPNFPYITGD